MGSGNTAVGLDGAKLIIAIVLNFVFGALMTLGCGLYAPCMVMVFMLGMNPIVAFPVMMGSAAALMPVAGKEFIAAGSYARKISLCFTDGDSSCSYCDQHHCQYGFETADMDYHAVVIYTSFTYVRKGLK